jgi:hypothetical protein
VPRHPLVISPNRVRFHQPARPYASALEVQSENHANRGDERGCAFPAAGPTPAFSFDTAASATSRHAG